MTDEEMLTRDRKRNPYTADRAEALRTRICLVNGESHGRRSRCHAHPYDAVGSRTVPGWGCTRAYSSSHGVRSDDTV
jgi:hypothetical protein